MSELIEVKVGYLIPDNFVVGKKIFSETYPYGAYDKDSDLIETVYVKRKKTKRTPDEAIAYCLEIGQDPYSYLDYSDLRNGKENWEYFVEIKND